MEEPNNYNVANNIIDNRSISTACWCTFIAECGGYVPTWETFVWRWDKEERKRKEIMKSFYHKSEKEAINFHYRLSKQLTILSLTLNKELTIK